MNIQAISVCYVMSVVVSIETQTTDTQVLRKCNSFKKKKRKKERKSTHPPHLSKIPFS